jgi:hypothetical protein
MKPVRLQLRRTAGYRMPAGAKHCARPSRWGNPFPVDMLGRDLAIEMFEDLVNGIFSPGKLAHLTDAQFATIKRSVEAWQRRIGGHPLELARAELRGCDLACHCGLSDRCHVDVLLRVANR